MSSLRQDFEYSDLYRAADEVRSQPHVGMAEVQRARGDSVDLFYLAVYLDEEATSEDGMRLWCDVLVEVGVDWPVEVYTDDGTRVPTPWQGDCPDPSPNPPRISE